MGLINETCGMHGGEEKLIQSLVEDLKEIGRLEHKIG
jgi:hypothetical protein